MTQGNNYYECDIKIDRLQDDGSQKFLKEKYLVKAATPTEAEKRMIDEFAAETSGELKVTQVKEVGFADIIIDNPESTSYKWFSTKVNIIILDEKTEKEKRTSQVILFRADDFKSACKHVCDYAEKSMCDMEILSVSETKIKRFFSKTTHE